VGVIVDVVGRRGGWDRLCRRVRLR